MLLLMNKQLAGILLIITLLCSCHNNDRKVAQNTTYKEQRKSMVEYQIRMRGVNDKAVLLAMNKVPRHLFVPEKFREMSYSDHPLPIGHKQTISQPYVVALMTELLNLKKDSKVLEVGTGSGYQAAILAEIAKEVYTIEIIEDLHKQATKTLKSLKYKNVKTKFGDGYKGWKEHAPYDAIIVTAAPEKVPPALVKQLKVGGRMCIPVGPAYSLQKLLLIEKKSKDKIRTRTIETVKFVPMVKKKKE